MTEPLIIEISNSIDWDGTTLLTLTRDDLTVTGQRYYAGSVSAGGVSDGTFFGLFQRQAVKLVGVSGPNHNSDNVLTVVTPYASNRIREKIDITTQMQFVLVYPDDLITLRTSDERAVVLQFCVNELTESEHIQYALSRVRPTGRRRFRITRWGTAFVAAASTWDPGFTFAPTKGVLYSNSIGNGMIPADALSLQGPERTVLARVRFSAITAGSGQVVMGEAITADFRAVQVNLSSGEWSRVFALGYKDGLGFNGSASGLGAAISVDIDVVDVLPGRHLTARSDDVAAQRTQLGVNDGFVPFRVDTLVGTKVTRVTSKYAGTLSYVDTRIDGALAVGDATLQVAINGTNVTTGLITITNLGSHAGDYDYTSPTALNRVEVGDELSLTCGGTNTAAVVANGCFTISQ